MLVVMKAQATPEYDQSFLIAPPTDEDESAAEESASAEQDPMYEEAVRLILQMGKASTSTLQRHLRLGYGRAARILDGVLNNSLDNLFLIPYSDRNRVDRCHIR